MSSSLNPRRINGRDLINVGIFTALLAVVCMAVMPLGFIPILMPLYCVLMPLISGIPWMLFITKVRKFGLILIMGILLGLFLMVGGMGWYALPLTIVSSLIAEFIVRAGSYTSARLDMVAHGVFSIWVFGSFIPLIFMADQYWAENASYGEEFISSAKGIFQLWTAPVLVLCCVVFGILGGALGLKIMKKHFVKAGIA
jgi:energy-coupling factor transport system substrate-specific component